MPQVCEVPCVLTLAVGNAEWPAGGTYHLSGPPGLFRDLRAAIDRLLARHAACTEELSDAAVSRVCEDRLSAHIRIEGV